MEYPRLLMPQCQIIKWTWEYEKGRCKQEEMLLSIQRCYYCDIPAIFSHNHPPKFCPECGARWKGKE